MLLYLPLLQAALRPCLESWAAMPITAAGRFCARCQHLVHDFTQEADPTAALAAARAASPTGRVCGRFAAAQVARPRLSGRLRRFALALLLVFGLGLPAHEALAQVRRAAATVKPATTSANRPRQPAHAHTTVQLDEVPTEYTIQGGVDGLEHSSQEVATVLPDTVLTYAEQMPALPGGTFSELIAHIQRQVRWPEGSGRMCAEGRVFVQLVVGKSGLVRDVEVVKSLEALLDAEAVRAVRTLGRLQPGRQQGQLVAIRVTLPVSFNRE